MSSRVIDIIIRTNDQTSAGLIAIQSKFLAMERSIQRLANRMKSFASARFQATVSLIDRVTEPGGRINAILKRFAEKAYRISVGITDSASSKLQSLNTLAAKLVSRTYTIAVNVKDNASKKLSGLTEGLMMGAGTFAPIAGAAGIGFGAANAVQAYMAFEKQMSAVQAVRQLDKDSSEMQALTQQAKDIGAQTAWTREQVGQAQYFAALAGWSTQQILQSTPHLVNLASAGNVDLKSASDIVTDSLTGFGLKAEETYVDKQGRTVNAVEHYADMMAKLQASSNTDILQMGEAFKYGAPTIGAMYSGKDIQTRMQAAEDAMIMTGLMANAGIKGSSAGTGINTIFNRMGSMNRNAYQALRAMGVDYQDEKGDMLSIGTIMRNLGSRFKEVVDPNQLLNFAEAISGEKIHADTRRKLDSFIEQTQKNGGKMSGADMLKMSSMLAGTEHMGKLLSVMLGDWDEMAAKMDNVHGTAQDMANIQLDNLAGDITILGSAWDAFQQDLVEGSASEGLRSFVQTLTEIISNAQNLFKDGIQIGDFGKIIFDVVDRLRAKFMELDGIGSILAGGVLMGALTKIGSKIRSLVNSFRELRMGSFGTSATSKSGVSAGQSVSTMTVHAGVVNVNGKVNGTPGGAGSRKVGNQAIIDNYNRTKETIRGGSTGSSSAASRFAGAKSAGVLGAGLAATFGVMDVMGVKEHSKARLQEAQDTVAYHENQLQSLRQSGATQAQIDAQIREVNDAKAFVARTEKLNHDEEFRAGAVATGYGTAIGADFEFKNPFADFEFKNPFADFEIKNPFEGFEVENPFANLFEGFEPPEIDFSGMADSALAQIEELGGRIREGLSSALDGAGENLSELGNFISEGLSTALDGASTAFDGLGEMISAGLEGAAASAEGALSTISSTFDSAREGIMSAWNELPSFFGGIFDGLGGVASSAGAAILSGLTSVCGSVISAWESVASTVSSIISTISAAASSVASMIPSIGGGGVGKAEGGFVTAETHFYAGEHGAEVVIPLSSSHRNRALDLYKKTGAILGGEPMNFGGDEIKSKPERDKLSNLPSVNIPDFNRINGDETISVQRDKRAAQEALLKDFPNRSRALDFYEKTGSILGNEIKSEPERDKFGNLPGVDIPDFNRINGNETISVQRDKRAAQESLLNDIPNRSQALDLYEKTGAIFGGEIKSEPERDVLGNLPGVDIPDYNRINGNETISVQRDKRAAQESLLNDNPVAQEQSSDSPKEISMGGINVTFNVTGENPQEILEAIREHIAEVTDSIAGKLSEQIAGVHANQPLEG